MLVLIFDTNRFILLFYKTAALRVGYRLILTIKCLKDFKVGTDNSCFKCIVPSHAKFITSGVHLKKKWVCFRKKLIILFHMDTLK